MIPRDAFAGKVAVVTGAGAGIGKASALALAEHGADVVLTDVRGDRLPEVARLVNRTGALASTFVADVSKREEVEALRDHVLEEFGRCDILHNNAGVSLGARFEDTTPADWEWIMGINFWGVLHGVQAFLPGMIERRAGHIVNTASIFGLCAAPGVSAYCATKFAIVGMTESLRAEMKRYGIGVSAICPGTIKTEIIRDGRIHLPDGAKASKGRLVDFYEARGWPPERVADAVVDAIVHDKGVVPVGPEAWVLWGIKRSSATAIDKMMGLADTRVL